MGFLSPLSQGAAKARVVEVRALVEVNNDRASLKELRVLIMNKIRKGDQVIVITGKYKGQRGEVLRVADDRLVVANINMVKRHTKPNPQANQPGGIVEREAPIHVSNVALFNNATGKGARVGIKALADGRKVRVFKTGEQVDV